VTMHRKLRLSSEYLSWSCTFGHAHVKPGYPCFGKQRWLQTFCWHELLAVLHTNTHNHTSVIVSI